MRPPRTRLVALHAPTAALLPYPHTTQCLVLATPVLRLSARVLSTAQPPPLAAPLDATALLFYSEDAMKRLCRTLKARVLPAAAWPADVAAQRVFRVVVALAPAGVHVQRRNYMSQVQAARKRGNLPPLTAGPALRAAALDARADFTLLDDAGGLPALMHDLGVIENGAGGDGLAPIGHVYLGLVPYEPLPAGDAARMGAYTDALQAAFAGGSSGGVSVPGLVEAFTAALKVGTAGGILAVGARGQGGRTAMLIKLEAE